MSRFIRVEDLDGSEVILNKNFIRDVVEVEGPYAKNKHLRVWFQDGSFVNVKGTMDELAFLLS